MARDAGTYLELLVFLSVNVFYGKAQPSSSSNTGPKQLQASDFTWLGYFFGGLVVVMFACFCFRKRRSSASTVNQPLLGGQYNQDGDPMTRKDIQDSEQEIEEYWNCEVCDFHNKRTSANCVLCGTEKGFSLGINPALLTHKEEEIVSGLERSMSSFNRQRSFAIRRLNMLNDRQKIARQRHEWFRRAGIDGRSHWSRRKLLPGQTSKSDLTKQPSLAFVAQLALTPTHPDGRMTFCEYQKVDASVAARGYNMTSEDLEIMEQVAALPFKDKYSWFLQQTTELLRPWEEGHLKMKVHRDNLLVESVEQLLGIELQHIHMPLRIEFIGESGIDAGGLEREWFTLLIEEIFDETIGLFKCAHVSNLAYVFNEHSEEASPDHLLYFKGIGRLIGRGLIEGQLMKSHLALPLLKHLLGVPISLGDLEFLDADVYKSLVWIKENSGVEALSLDFSVTTRKLCGDMVVIDLKPDGRNIEVTDENKGEYINLRLRYAMLGCFAEQLKHLMNGIFEVIPQELLLVFDYQELELVLCGVPSIDVDDWRKYTEVSAEIPQTTQNWFWEIIQTYTDEERAKLLQFVTGSARVPVQGFKALTSYDGRVCRFTLKGIPYPQNAYPRAHTCFNRMDLPLYKEKAKLEEALSLVINMEVTGFTGD